MAKKTKAKIQLSKAEGDSVEPLSFADSSDLPAYHRYVDATEGRYHQYLILSEMENSFPPSSVNIILAQNHCN